jgi:hypothetical protein
MKALLLPILLCFGFSLAGQQLFFEGFTTFNRTKYKESYLAEKTPYWGGGGRVGFGADHVQVGGEYRGNLSNPSFCACDSISIANYGESNIAFKENYKGGFVRVKISRYPAMRFGLVIRLGVGVINTTAVSEKNGISLEQAYDPTIGFNGEIGFSTPIFKYSKTMVEVGYRYNYAQLPTLNIAIDRPTIPSHNAISHMFSFGLSHGFVFGERAKQYEHARQNWKYRKGWRG